nr:uncharacterized protein LOC104119535 isoform X1 [Nicotiana tomentosiformis]
MPSQRWHFYCNVLEKSNTDPLVYLQIHSDFLTRFVLSYAIPKMAFLLQFSFKGHHFVVLPLQSAVLLPVVLQLLVDLPYLGVGLLLVQLLSYRCKRQTSKLVVMEVSPLHPGPASLELLLLQAEHRSSYMWEWQLLAQTFRARRVDDM